MNDAGVIFLLGYALFWGMRKGASVCVTICTPSLIPHIIEKKMSWRQGLKAGILFNLPRIIFLTAIGALIGYVSFTLIHTIEFQSIIRDIGSIGYFLVGIFLFIYGGYTFAHGIEEAENIKEGKLCERTHQENIHPHAKFITAIARKISKNENSFLLAWGAILGLVCISEVIFTLETALLSGVVAALGGNYLNAMLLGASTMFMFAIGASLPVILVTTISAGLSAQTKKEKVLNLIKIISSVMMIAIGLILILNSLTSIAF
jgi:sulfite exporter TauE/SafE